MLGLQVVWVVSRRHSRGLSRLTRSALPKSGSKPTQRTATIDIESLEVRIPTHAVRTIPKYPSNHLYVELLYTRIGGATAASTVRVSTTLGRRR